MRAFRIVLLAIILFAFFLLSAVASGPPELTPACTSVAPGSVSVSSRLLNAGLGQTIDRTVPVRDVVLGFHVTGTARLTGTVVLRPLPYEERAALDVLFTGTAVARDIDCKPPVQLITLDTTHFCVVKRALIDLDGMSGLPPSCRAATHSCLLGIDTGLTGLRGCVVRRFWAARFPAFAPRVEEISARHFEQQLVEESERDFARQQVRFNQQLADQIGTPLEKAGLLDSEVRIVSNFEEVRLTASTGDIPTSAPPAPEGRPDLVLRLHHSLVETVTERTLGGRTVTDEELQRGLDRLAESLTFAAGPPADTSPWSITFAHRKPVSVAFTAGQVILTLRGAEFTSAERRYPAMDITARYELRRTATGLRAVRKGELDIFPPGFVPGSGARLSNRQLVTRAVLRRRFDRLLGTEIALERLTLPGEMARAGSLHVEQLLAAEGWLMVGWRLAPSVQRGQ